MLAFVTNSQGMSFDGTGDGADTGLVPTTFDPPRIPVGTPRVDTRPAIGSPEEEGYLPSTQS